MWGASHFEGHLALSHPTHPTGSRNKTFKKSTYALPLTWTHWPLSGWYWYSPSGAWEASETLGHELGGWKGGVWRSSSWSSPAWFVLLEKSGKIGIVTAWKDCYICWGPFEGLPLTSFTIFQSCFCFFVFFSMEVVRFRNKQIYRKVEFEWILLVFDMNLDQPWSLLGPPTLGFGAQFILGCPYFHGHPWQSAAWESHPKKGRVSTLNELSCLILT